MTLIYLLIWLLLEAPNTKFVGAIPMEPITRHVKKLPDEIPVYDQELTNKKCTSLYNLDRYS